MALHSWTQYIAFHSGTFSYVFPFSKGMVKMGTMSREYAYSSRFTSFRHHYVQNSTRFLILFYELNESCNELCKLSRLGLMHMACIAANL